MTPTQTNPTRMQIIIRIATLTAGLFIGACTLVELNQASVQDLINTAIPYIKLH